MTECHPDRKHCAFGLCKKCYSAKRYADNPDKSKERSKNNRLIRMAEDPEREREYGRKWRRDNPDCARATARKHKYGITPEQFDAMFTAQGGCCKVCGDRPKTLSVDHCHNTLKVRGLLCHKCNSALGLMKHQTTILESAISYLEGTA